MSFFLEKSKYFSLNKSQRFQEKSCHKKKNCSGVFPMKEKIIERISKLFLSTVEEYE